MEGENFTLDKVVVLDEQLAFAKDIGQEVEKNIDVMVQYDNDDAFKSKIQENDQNIYFVGIEPTKELLTSLEQIISTGLIGVFDDIITLFNGMSPNFDMTQFIESSTTLLATGSENLATWSSNSNNTLKIFNYNYSQVNAITPLNVFQDLIQAEYTVGSAKDFLTGYNIDFTTLSVQPNFPLDMIT